MNNQKTIQIPPATLARLEQMITQRNTIDGQVEVIVATLRDALDVPTHYVIGDIRQGFVPPPEESAAPPT